MLLTAAVAMAMYVGSAWAQEPHAHDEHGARPPAAGAVHAETGAKHEGAAEHAGEHGPTSFKDDLPLWGIVAFIGFIFAIKKLGWGSFTSGMNAREAEERRLIQEAEDLRRQTADQLRVQRGQLEALDETVRAALAVGGQHAEQTRRDIRAAADRDAATAKTRAEQEISRVKDQTLGELFENFTQRIVDATQERLRGRLDPVAQDKLIDAALTDFIAGQQKSA